MFCSICDKLCIERFYKSQLKSQIHTNNIRKIENSIRQNETTITKSTKDYIDSLYVLDKSFQVISHYINMDYICQFCDSLLIENPDEYENYLTTSSRKNDENL